MADQRLIRRRTLPSLIAGLRELRHTIDVWAGEYGASVDLAQHWHADSGQGELCVRCRTTWPCAVVVAAAPRARADRRESYAQDVMDVHQPAHAGPRTLEQCRGCPPGTAWPCEHWGHAADQPDSGSST